MGTRVSLDLERLFSWDQPSARSLGGSLRREWGLRGSDFSERGGGGLVAVSHRG